MTFRAAANLLFAGVIMGILWCSEHEYTSRPFRYVVLKAKWGHVCAIGEQGAVPVGAAVGFGLALIVVVVDRLTKR